MKIVYFLADRNYKDVIISFYDKMIPKVFSELSPHQIYLQKQLSKFYVTKMLTDPNFYIFIAFDKDTNNVVGVLPLELDKTDGIAVLGMFIVDDKYRKQGIGTTLLNRAISFSRSHNQKKLIVLIRSYDKEVIHFFISHNFIIEKRIRHWLTGAEFIGLSLSL